MSTNSLQPVRNFSYECIHKTQLLPKATEKPVFGLKAGKNLLFKMQSRTFYPLPAKHNHQKTI